ncbi:MAG TPA: DegT/DnrJ/EryC1/StrS family aminotransferase [Terriglobales bacterium]|nr:DegT/DnrJ/EryC1/StrS family aminotransferase [Terriglobales bacterium]
MDEPIPLARPEVTDEDISAVSAVLRTPFLSGGPELLRFEAAIAAYAGVPHAIAVNSGTSALHLILRSSNLKPGDEVIVPSFAFAAVGNVLLQENLVPVFADIEADTFNLDLTSIQNAIGPQTRAILFVQTFGIPAKVQELRKVADAMRLFLIEDASEALGTSIGNQRAGSFGDASVFAFYPNKMLTTGEGGAVVTANSEIADRCRRLRNQGRQTSADWYQQMEVGFSYRLSEMNCALGRSQLSRIDSVLRRRKKIAEAYRARLEGNPDLKLVTERPGEAIGWFTYPVLLSDRFNQKHRDRLWLELNGVGIGCARYFAPLHRQPVTKGRCRVADNLTITDSVSSRIFQLPFFNEITEGQIDRVCQELTWALNNLRC